MIETGMDVVAGFLIGVGFMMIVLAATLMHRDRRLVRLEIENAGLRKELGDAIGAHHAYVLKYPEGTVHLKHPEMGRPPPASPVGDVP